MSKYSDLVERLAWDMKETLAPINEYTYDQLTKKQASIDSLFPGRFRPRVAAVKSNGGVSLETMQPDRWEFSIASGTTPGKKYDAIVNFDNLMDIVSAQAQNKYLWTKNNTKIDLRKMAKAVLEDGNLQIVCSCPADLYYGGQYIRTKKNSKYTEPEKRPPNIRNKKQYGAYCKHLEVLMQSFNFFNSDMAHFLKKYYSKEIIALEDAVKQQQAVIAKGAEFLKKKEAEKLANPEQSAGGETGQFKKGSV